MRYDFYIMNASCLFDKKATDIPNIIQQWEGDDMTIMVCRREYAYDKFSTIFVVGSGNSKNDYVDSKASLPHLTDYVQDTGNGYGARGSIYIDNVIRVFKNGIIKPRNMLGFGKKHRCWVMK